MSMTREEILRKDLICYLAGKTVTDEEYRELCSWIASGNSIHANPWYMAGEDGRELDFLTARQVMMEMQEEC